MNVNEAIESLFSYLRNGISQPTESTVCACTLNEEFSKYINLRATKAGVFFMGNYLELRKAIHTVEDGLKEDLKERVPLPFDEIFTLTKFDENVVSDPGILWEADFVARVPNHLLDEEVKANGVKDPIFFVKLLYRFKVGWVHAASAFADYRGLGDEGFNVGLFSRSRNGAGLKNLGYAISSSFQDVALISHPMNYILLESPRLTPREERRLKDGKHISAQKRPRYIIVDHDVLVGMQDGGGAHASPTPHQRRGHWMRLAERCIHAKARGDQRVWVRPHYVGKLEFDRNGSRYQVLMDFRERIHSKEAAQ